MKTEKKKIDKPIFVAHVLRQMLWMNFARYCCLSNGLQYVHLLNGVKMLINIVGEKTLKEFLGDKYETTNIKLKEFEKKVIHITSFCTNIHSKDFRDSNFFDEKFRNYYHSLSEFSLLHQELLDIFLFLLSKTTLINSSIPSSYFSLADKEISLKTIEQEEREHRFLTHSERQFKDTLEDKGNPEEVEQDEDKNEVEDIDEN